MLKIRQSQLNLASLTYVLVKAFRVAVVVMVGGGGVVWSPYGIYIYPFT